MRNLRLHFFQRILTALILASILGIANFGHAGACRCSHRSPEQEFAVADAVFTGEAVSAVALAKSIAVDEIPFADANVAVTFRVTTAWKGPAQEMLTVYTNSQSTACGYWFVVGQPHLVYARQSGAVLVVDSCSRTAMLENANKDLMFLRQQPNIPLSATETSASQPPTSTVLLVAIVIGGAIVVMIAVRRQRTLSL